MAIFGRLFGKKPARPDPERLLQAILAEEHRALLRRCREVGVERAFREKAEPSVEEMMACLPPEAREVLAGLLAGGISSPEEGGPTAGPLAEHGDL